jgi:hypothetical protein
MTQIKMFQNLVSLFTNLNNLLIKFSTSLFNKLFILFITFKWLIIFIINKLFFKLIQISQMLMRNISINFAILLNGLLYLETYINIKVNKKIRSFKCVYLILQNNYNISLLIIFIEYLFVI